jgi:hypothetical protein
MRANPLCQACEKEGRIKVWEELDHIVPLHLGGEDTDDNRQGLCKACHDRKSASEGMARALDGGWRTAELFESAYPEWLTPAACWLTIVFGPPAAGKSTYIQKHAADGDSVIDLDEIIARLSDKPLYERSSEWLQPALDERNRLLAGLSTSSTRTWFITTGTKPRRAWWCGKLQPTATVTLDTAEQTCVSRIRSDDRRRAIAQEQIQAVRNWWRIETARPRETIGADGWPIHKFPPTMLEGGYP